MKFLKNLLFLFSFLLIFACAKEDKGGAKAKQPAKKSVQNKKNTKTSNKKGNKAANKKKAPAKAANKVTKAAASPYWTELKKTVKLTEAQIGKLQVMQRKFTQAKNKINKQGGANKDKEISKLRAKKDKEMKALLGNNVFSAKRKFDKDWYAKANNK